MYFEKEVAVDSGDGKLSFDKDSLNRFLSLLASIQTLVLIKGKRCIEAVNNMLQHIIDGDFLHLVCEEDINEAIESFCKTSWRLETIFLPGFEIIDVVSFEDITLMRGKNQIAVYKNGKKIRSYSGSEFSSLYGIGDTLFFFYKKNLSSYRIVELSKGRVELVEGSFAKVYLIGDDNNIFVVENDDGQYFLFPSGEEIPEHEFYSLEEKKAFHDEGFWHKSGRELFYGSCFIADDCVGFEPTRHTDICLAYFFRNDSESSKIVNSRAKEINLPSYGQKAPQSLTFEAGSVLIIAYKKKVAYLLSHFKNHFN